MFVGNKEEKTAEYKICGLIKKIKADDWHSLIKGLNEPFFKFHYEMSIGALAMTLMFFWQVRVLSLKRKVWITIAGNFYFSPNHFCNNFPKEERILFIVDNFYKGKILIENHAFSSVHERFVVSKCKLAVPS